MDTLLKNYMPSDPSDECVEESAKICTDEKVFSDQSGLSNREKWDYIQSIFNCEGQCTLFSSISFESIYQEDDAARCGAAAFVADLRVQYLRAKLTKNSVDLATHVFYVRNKQWWAKLRERTNLNRFSEMIRDTRLT